MEIERVLEKQGWQLVKRENWIAVRDDRAAFRSEFGGNRVGKLVGSKFYVTPTDLQATAEHHVDALGLMIEKIPSTSGRDREYAGFETEGIAETTLVSFAEALHGEIQKRLQK